MSQGVSIDDYVDSLEVRIDEMECTVGVLEEQVQALSEQVRKHMSVQAPTFLCLSSEIKNERT